MDGDIIKLVLSYQLNTEDSSLQEKTDNLYSKKDLLLAKPVVLRISKVITDILIKSHNAVGSSSDQSIGKPIVELLQSWCQTSHNDSHDIGTPETLSEYITKLINTFPNLNIETIEDVRLFRACIKNNITEHCTYKPENEIWRLYQKRKVMVQARKISEYLDVQHAGNHPQFNWNAEEKPVAALMPQMPVLSNTLGNQTQRTTHKQPIEAENIVSLAYALVNLKQFAGVEYLLQKIISEIICGDYTINDVRHIVNSSDVYPGKLSSTDMQCLLWEDPLTIETCILKICQIVSLEIKLDININYDIEIHKTKLKNQVYNVLKGSEFLTLCEYCSKSKLLFHQCNLCFNHVLMKSKFDIRIQCLILNYIEIITNYLHRNNDKLCRLIDLYPEDLRHLLFWLNLPHGELSSNRKEGLIKLRKLYQEKSNTLPMLLSHFPKWIPEFKSFIFSSC